MATSLAVSVPVGAATPIGSQIVNAFASATDTSAAAVNTAIAAAASNPGDPTNMIAMQVAMANYNIALSVQSSVIKSIEETAKSITQKL
jgi:type III secretion apparatus needle protein